MDWNRIRPQMAATLVGISLAASTAAAQTTGLRVQYRIPGAAVGDNHVRPHLSVVNAGTTTVPMSELTMRYWYTVDGVRPQVYVCDYTPRGCGNVTSQFVAVSPARTNADFYLQVGFTAGMGSLAAGQSTGEIQGRFNKDNWTNYDESNDYSYDPTKTAFADWTRVTLYRNGALVWGTEPGGGTGGDFSLAAAAATVNQGQSGSSTITITRSGTFTGTVNLTASGQPANVTVALNPAAATGATSTANITVGAAAAAGTYPITITGTATGITGSRTATLNLTVGGGANFSLAAAPLTIGPGASGTSAITISRTSFAGAVNLTASGQPANVTVTLTPASTTGNSSTANITVGAAVPAGTYPITITGTATGITGSRTATLSLTVVTGANFSLAAAAVTIGQGASGASAITITRTSFTGAVSLTASGQPANVTVTVTPASTTGNSGTANITVGAAVPAGTYPVTITGTATGITGPRTATLNLTVVTGANFSLAAAAVAIGQGASGTSAITITRTSFTGAVNLTASGQPANVTVTLTPASTTGNSTASITVGAAVPAGTYPITITGTATGITGSRTATLNLTVGAGANFSLSANPSSVSIAAGSSGTSTITVARTGGFTGAVTLTGPAGVTFNPNPIPAAPATTSTATLSVAAGTPAGTSVITISGTATGITGTRTTTINRTVTAGGAVFRVDPTGRITKNGAAFPVRCGSWFGLEGRHEPSNDPQNPSGAPMELYIGNTFWANGGAGTGRTIQQTMTEIVARGINVVRMPVVPQTLNPSDPQGTGSVLKNHPSVRVANSRLALEQFIRLADQNNIEVMLDMHSCSNYVGWRKGRLDARPPYADFDRDNYDFKRENFSCAATGNPSTVTTIHPYNTTAWLNDLRTLAGLGTQLGVDNIIGIDIFNEPHDYTWQEWKALTEAAYQAINAVNPNTLLFVQGISATAGKQDGTPNTVIAVPHGDEATNPNWGENLFEAGANPITMPRERLVYSPHVYGPSVFVQKMFMDPAQAQCAGLEGDAAGDANCNIVIDPPLLREGWEEHFGYLRDLGYAVVVGEFGGNLDWPLGQASLRDRNRWSHVTPGIDAEWQNAFVDYMTDRGIEGCYWSINPESGDTAGWYGHAYDPVSNTAGWGEWRDFDQRKTNLLDRLWGR